jgi:nucleoside-diphosphate-sugar epimerase
LKRALVTGGTGFVGANLVRRLLRDGHDVTLLLRERHNPWRIAAVREALRLHVVELADAERLEAVVAAIRPDWVFHLATHGAYPAQTDLDEMIRTNIMGTINLVRACLKTGFEAFVNTGSSSEYGFKDQPTTEAESLEPNSHYAVTKASATLFCRYTAQRHQVHLPTLRLYSAYGPYEEPTRLMPTLVAQGVQGRLPPLVDPDIARDFVYVEDVCEAYLLAATVPGQAPGAIYNLGGGSPTTLRDVVLVAQRVLGITVEPVWGSMQNRSWDTPMWAADNSKIRAALSWEPRHSLDQGFRHMLDWFRCNPEFWPRYGLLQVDPT